MMVPRDKQYGMLWVLGETHDRLGRYAEAFSYYSTANAEMAKRMHYDASRHRRTIVAIKRVFRDPRGSASEVVAPMDQVPVFVVGMSRSGKTLVDSLLAPHEDVYCAGESSEWRKAVRAVLQKRSISPAFPEFMNALSGDDIRDMGRIYMENIVKRSPNSKLFISTLFGNSRSIGLITQALPRAKIIYCHRDPMDNCLFVYFKRYADGNDYSYDLGNIASFYVCYHDMMAHWRKLYGDRILGVRYEDMVRDPAEIGARIYRYCGLDYDPGKASHAFTTDEIGHWKNYEPYLGRLRQALGGLARQSNDRHDTDASSLQA